MLLHTGALTPPICRFLLPSVLVCRSWESEESDWMGEPKEGNHHEGENHYQSMTSSKYNKKGDMITLS